MMVPVPANKSNPFGTPAYKRILQVGRHRRSASSKGSRRKITQLTATSSSPGLPLMAMRQKGTPGIVYRFVFDKLI